MRTYTRYFAGTKIEVEQAIKDTLKPSVRLKDATVNQKPGDNRMFATIVFEEVNIAE